jgi:hypothetical protein
MISCHPHGQPAGPGLRRKCLCYKWTLSQHNLQMNSMTQVYAEKQPAPVCSSFWRLMQTCIVNGYQMMEVNLVGGFKMNYPVTSFLIQSADDVCRVQSINDLRCKILRNLWDSSAQSLYPLLFQALSADTTRPHEETEDIEQLATASENRHPPNHVQSGEYITSSQWVTTVTSGTIVLGTAATAFYYASNHFGTHNSL